MVVSDIICAGNVGAGFVVAAAVGSSDDNGVVCKGVVSGIIGSDDISFKFVAVDFVGVGDAVADDVCTVVSGADVVGSTVVNAVNAVVDVAGFVVGADAVVTEVGGADVGDSGDACTDVVGSVVVGPIVGSGVVGPIVGSGVVALIVGSGVVVPIVSGDVVNGGDVDVDIAGSGAVCQRGGAGGEGEVLVSIIEAVAISLGFSHSIASSFPKQPVKATRKPLDSIHTLHT